MPEVLIRAIASVALAWGWKRWAALTLLGFYSITRIGEVLNAERKDLFTPEDLLEKDGQLFLLVREPKTRHRGARIQHAVCEGPAETLAFIATVFQILERRWKLYGGSPGVYRRRWDCILRQLGVPATLRLTPGSVRGGGAVAAHSDIQWRMRLGHQSSLAYYLQETTAASILPSLSGPCRENVLAAEACLPFLFKLP